jgi:type II secretory pathway pseudopilin PulG
MCTFGRGCTLSCTIAKTFRRSLALFISLKSAAQASGKVLLFGKTISPRVTLGNSQNETARNNNADFSRFIDVGGWHPRCKGTGPRLKKTAIKLGKKDLVKLNKIEDELAVHDGWRSQTGRSIVETLIVVAIIALLTAAAVPQMISARRLIRSAALPREVATQLRYARQLAMSQRQAVTFQYDNSAKTVKIFDHNNVNNATAGCNMTGLAVLSASGYPNTSCTTTILTVPLATAGLPVSEVTYGIPATITATTLDDGNTLTALSGTPAAVNVTFQSDGTVMTAAGGYARPTLFFYNNQVPTQTASAISILGAAGRIKIWRYSTSASKFAE